MTDREKLEAIINTWLAITGWIRSDELVDLLIAHGVMVREPQKPIAETDLGKYLDTPVWFEEFERNVEERPLLLDGIGIYYAEFKEFGETERLDRRLDDYNFQWRCWAEKPTEEERKAAEWEK